MIFFRATFVMFLVFTSLFSFSAEDFRKNLLGTNENFINDFIKKGALNLHDRKTGTTALMEAASVSNADAVRALIRAGADIESRDSGNRSALSFAMASECASVIHILLGENANMLSKDLYGKTALSYFPQDGNNQTRSVIAHYITDKQIENICRLASEIEDVSDFPAQALSDIGSKLREVKAADIILKNDRTFRSTKNLYNTLYLEVSSILGLDTSLLYSPGKTILKMEGRDLVAYWEAVGEYEATREYYQKKGYIENIDSMKSFGVEWKEISRGLKLSGNLIHAGEIYESYLILKDLSAKYSDIYEIRIAYANVLLALEKWKEAYNEAMEARKLKEEAHSLILLASALMRLGEYNEAQYYFEAYTEEVSIENDPYAFERGMYFLILSDNTNKDYLLKAQEAFLVSKSPSATHNVEYVDSLLEDNKRIENDKATIKNLEKKAEKFSEGDLTLPGGLRIVEGRDLILSYDKNRGDYFLLEFIAADNSFNYYKISIISCPFVVSENSGRLEAYIYDLQSGNYKGYTNDDGKEMLIETGLYGNQEIFSSLFGTFENWTAKNIPKVSIVEKGDTPVEYISHSMRFLGRFIVFVDMLGLKKFSAEGSIFGRYYFEFDKEDSSLIEAKFFPYKSYTDSENIDYEKAIVWSGKYYLINGIPYAVLGEIDKKTLSEFNIASLGDEEAANVIYNKLVSEKDRGVFPPYSLKVRNIEGKRRLLMSLKGRQSDYEKYFGIFVEKSGILSEKNRKTEIIIDKYSRPKISYTTEVYGGSVGQSILEKSAASEVEDFGQIRQNTAGVIIKDFDGFTRKGYVSGYFVGNQKRFLVRLSKEDEDKVDYIDSKPPLIWAIIRGYLSLFREMVVNGMSLSPKDEEGKTALFWACAMGRDREIKMLVENGASVIPVDNLGRSTLLWASAYASGDSVYRIIQKGADVNKADSFGKTPLMWAAKTGNVETIKVLTSFGAKETATDKEGKTAIDIARMFNREEIVRYFETPLQDR